MRTFTRSLLTLALGTAAFCCAAFAQDKPNSATNNNLASYDVKRETTLVGTVQAYTAASPTAPLGPHVTMQTAGGLVDVHLGDARLLAANHFTIQPGDTLRIIGELVAYGKGTQFVVRIVQNGTQAIAIRSVRGFPLSYMAPRDAAQSKPQGGVL